MNKETSHNIRLGIFVIAGAILLIFGLYSIGSNKNMFSETFKLTSTFYDVNGLTVGNNVRYSGIDVGTVEAIEILNDSAIQVVMLIDDKVKKYIRRNSIASVGTDGLMGNKIVNIFPGTPDEPLVEENDAINSIKVVNTEEMLRTLELTNNNIAVISKNLKAITENVYKSRGTLYTVLMDTVLARNVENTLGNIHFVSNNLVETSHQLSNIATEANSRNSLFGVMLKDTTLANDLRVAVTKVREGSEQFSKISNDITEVVSQLNSGKGIAASLLKDSTMTDDLKASLVNIQAASKKLDEDLEALKHSFLLKGYFKKLEKQKN